MSINVKRIHENGSFKLEIVCNECRRYYVIDDMVIPEIGVINWCKISPCMCGQRWWRDSPMLDVYICMPPKSVLLSDLIDDLTGLDPC